MTAPTIEQSAAATQRDQVRAANRAAVLGTAGIAVASVLVGIIVVGALSDEPGVAIATFLTGAFDGTFRTGTTLALATPLIFTGAALALSFRVGIFNLGAEGQLYLGAAAGTWLAVSLPTPGPVTLLLAIIGGAATGAAWAAIPGWLKAVYRTDEVVITLMQNFVAVLFVSWLVSGPLGDPERPGFPQSERIPDGAQLPRLLQPSSVHLGLVIGIVVCVAGHRFLTRSTAGFEMRISGENPEFARYIGMRPRRSILMGMVMSGSLAGMGGAVHILGDQLRLLDGFSPGYGFTGILIALLARRNLLAIPFAALFFSWLIGGAQAMEETTDVPREAVSVVQAVLFLMITATALTLWIQQRAAQTDRGVS